MNTGKIVVNLIIKRSFRNHKKGYRAPNPGIQSRLNILEDDAENNLEAIQNLDIEDVESDFMQAHQSYDSHKKELSKNKDLLKLRIVARKYFDDSTPSLLTFVEKEQIRHLHNSDPVEYTPEKLSESFPALPHTIRKILKANWIPKSADRVVKHDQLVIENWKKFKLGEIMIEPRLKEHLEKFKHRKISLPKIEDIETKLLPPPKIFPKPKGQLYSGIIQSYLDKKKDNDDNVESDQSVNRQRSEKNGFLQRGHASENNELVSNSRYGKEIGYVKDKEAPKSLTTKGAKRDSNELTLNEFFESSVKKIDSTPSIEDRVLMDTYRRKMESDTVKDIKIVEDNRRRIEKLNSKSEDYNSVTVLTNRDLQISIDDNIRSENIKVFDDSKETGLATYVKSREVKNCDEESYPQFITIPKNKYQKGKIYKLRDCYYDNDGEFLYRVPGLKE